jgi:hypothetical protein
MCNTNRRVMRERVVTDVQELAGALATVTTAGRKRLTFDEVLSAGQPAMYRSFGESLLYVGGRLFDIREPGSPIEVGLALPPQGRAPAVADRAVTVGLEYGWHHAADCPCAFCSAAREAA